MRNQRTHTPSFDLDLGLFMFLTLYFVSFVTLLQILRIFEEEKNKKEKYSFSV